MNAAQTNFPQTAFIAKTHRMPKMPRGMNPSLTPCYASNPEIATYLHRQIA
ncbi:hypothetical protein FORC53_1284 [Vibrio vulnificus]|uniref:Uncharacterized protein n=1 Tax=Vibrio vulnificus TaxID=672 RepID=A0AAN1PN55_VIBVL|nr:hypothetical protein FORC53_1284 [Vibrio vulnificus]